MAIIRREDFYNQKRTKHIASGKTQQRFASSSHLTAKGHDSPKATHAPGLLTPSPRLLGQDSVPAKPVSVDPTLLQEQPGLAGAEWTFLGVVPMSRRPAARLGRGGAGGGGLSQRGVCLGTGEARHSPCSSRGPCPAKTYSRIPP